MTDFIADGRAARFARNDYIAITEFLQPVGEQRNLRGFAAAFRAFECDEQTFAHNFLNRAPLGVSSITQPFNFNSWRIWSARLKSFAFFANVRSPANAAISGGAPTPHEARPKPEVIPAISATTTIGRG